MAKRRVRVIAIVMAFGCVSFGQGVTLSLGSGSGVSGGTVTLSSNYGIVRQTWLLSNGLVQFYVRHRQRECCGRGSSATNAGKSVTCFREYVLDLMAWIRLW